MIEEMQRYTAEGAYPFHMPGHKRNPAYFWADPSMDFTEIDGFDDLHAPEGLIAQLQRDLAEAYGAKESFLLVNGSTAGNLAAILGSTRPGDRVLAAANCHKSVWNALCMQDVTVDVLQPRYTEDGLWGLLMAKDAERALTADNAPAAVVITAPTYEGVMPDVASIAEAVHARGAVLIVDAAHGAHFFDGHFPDNPCTSGADIVVMSLHKTLPCYGQTAVLHICSDRADRARIAERLGMLQTSSPSYMLMAQASACVRWMKTKAPEEMAAFAARLSAFRAGAEGWKHLRLRPTDDPSKLVIGTAGTGIGGPALADRLRRTYHLEMELEAADYVLALTSVCDTEEGFARLSAALCEIDAGLSDGNSGLSGGDAGRIGSGDCADEPAVPARGISCYAAFMSAGEWVRLSEAEGRVARRGAFVYPPGIPSPAPGERIRGEHIRRLERALSEGLSLRGVRGGAIECVREGES